MEFTKEVQVMLNGFESMESELDATLRQNEFLNDRLLEATLTHDIINCVMIHSENRNDTLSDEIEKIKMNPKITKRNWFVPKTEEKQILIKPVTSQTLSNKNKDVIGNTNVIAPGMYKLKTYNNQETHAQSNKSVSTSIRLRGVTSVRRPSSKISSWKNSILSHIKIYPENVEVHVGKNKKTNVTSHVNVFKTKDHVAKVNPENVLNVNVSVTYVSYDKNVLTLSVKSKFLDTIHVVAKTRFDIVTPLIAKDAGNKRILNCYYCWFKLQLLVELTAAAQD
ncbi:hypothetical protein Tco_1378242 [Tanacetum coccineum]